MSLPDITPDTFVEVWPGEGRPEIAILMPIYRQPQYVRIAVDSILAQGGVVAEIIISDDASGDGTFEAACQSVQDWLTTRGSPHRIVMRRGSQRLWRDHLPLLVDQASCDLVCQAHGDDIAHPHRARILVAMFRAQPNATMLASESILIDPAGRLAAEPRPVDTEVTASRYTFQTILLGHPDLIGYTQAWRRSAVSRFKRLDRNLAAVAHDRILAFRAALAGEVFLVRAQLIQRREHPLAAHNLMFDEPDTSGNFGWGVARLTALTAMQQDLALALEIGLVDAGRQDELAGLIVQLMQEVTRNLVEAYRVQTRAGRQIAWVDEETLLQLRNRRNLLPGGQDEARP